MELNRENVQRPSLRLLAVGAFIVLFVLVVYTFLHEAGHALVGVAFGQRLGAFDISFWDLSAHVSMSGSLTPMQRAIQVIAGAGLPFLLWALLMSVAPRKGNVALTLLKLVGSMAVINSLLAWLVLPVLDIFGRAPAGDDVTNFLRASGVRPALLSAVVLALYAAGWLLFLAKSEGVRDLTRQLQDLSALRQPSTRATLLAMSVVLAVVLGLSVAAGAFAAQGQRPVLEPPQGYVLAADVDLSARAHTEESLAQFTLEAPDVVRVFFVVREIDTAYLDLGLAGADAGRQVILHGEGYRSSGASSGSWEQRLEAGTYTLLLTAEQSPGTLTVYWELPQ